MTPFRQLALRKARKIAPWSAGAAMVGGSVAAFGVGPTALALAGGLALCVGGGFLIMVGIFVCAGIQGSQNVKRPRLAQLPKGP